jgi:hypothetical protein
MGITNTINYSDPSAQSQGSESIVLEIPKTKSSSRNHFYLSMEAFGNALGFEHVVKIHSEINEEPFKALPKQDWEVASYG